MARQYRKIPKNNLDCHIPFFAALSKAPNVTQACEISGLSTGYVYQQRKNNPEFAEKFELAMTLGIQSCEDEAMRRAFKGVEKGVYYQGKQVGVEYEPSDRLAEFMLKAHKPEKYRENSMTFNMGANSLVQVLSGMPRSDVLEAPPVLEALENKEPDGASEA